MTDSSSTPDQPGKPHDRVTDLLRGLIALEAKTASEAQTRSHVRYVGDYELLEEIATGGMGVVFRARQASLNRDVALKMILAGNLADEEAVERFRREAQAAARLQHPGIVGVFEVGEHAGQQYFSMELVEGEDLATVVARGPLPARSAAELIRKVAEAIHYAHDQGILHRDLKPSNILIDRAGEPRVTDFGLARRIDGSDRRTLSGVTVGTPSYMSPEQARGEQAAIGAASDVYSLGAVLYELLTGRPPFQADSPLRTLQQVLEHDAPTPSLLNPQVPRDLDVICMKCLQKSPERRYATVQDLVDDLTRFLERRPIAARPSGPLTRLAAWVRRHPWSLVAATSLLLVTSLGISYWMWVERVYWQTLANGAEQTDPGLAAPTAEPFRAWFSILFVVVVVSFFHVSSEQSSFRRARPGRLSLLALTGAGLLGIGWSVWTAKTLIDASVWTGTAPMAQILYIYVLVYMGLFILLRVFYAQGPRAAGPTSALTIEQEDELLDFLETGGKRGFRKRFALAKQRYIQWTGADPFDAGRVLRKMWCDLRLLDPENIPSPRRLTPWLLVLAFLLFGFFSD